MVFADNEHTTLHVLVSRNIYSFKHTIQICKKIPLKLLTLNDLFIFIFSWYNVHVQCIMGNLVYYIDVSHTA